MIATVSDYNGERERHWQWHERKASNVLGAEPVRPLSPMLGPNVA